MMTVARQLIAFGRLKRAGRRVRERNRRLGRKTTNRLRAIETENATGGKSTLANVARQLIAFGRLKPAEAGWGPNAGGPRSQDN